MVSELDGENYVLFEGNYYRKVAHQLTTLPGRSQFYLPLLPTVAAVHRLSPGGFLNWKLAADDKLYEQQVQEKNREVTARAATMDERERQYLLRTPIDLPRSPLRRRSEYIYALVKGENLTPIMGLSGVDRRRTTCTNMHVLRKLFGIENCYSYIVRALNNVIASSGNYVHPTHIKLIAELMCSRGSPLGLSFTAVGRLNYGHVTGSTIAKAGQVLTRSAIHGREETVNNTSAAINMGVLIKIGTGYTDVVQKVTINGQTELLINDEITARFKESEEERNSDAQVIAATTSGASLDDSMLSDLQTMADELLALDEVDNIVDKEPINENVGERVGQVPLTVQKPAVVVPALPEVDLVPGLPDLSSMTIDRVLTAQNMQRQLTEVVASPISLFDLQKGSE